MTYSFLLNYLKGSNCILALRTLVVYRLMLICLFNRTLKRKYNWLNTKFKDLKESKAAELDAKAQV